MRSAGVTLRTGCDELGDVASFDDVVVATGVTPRRVNIESTRADRIHPYDAHTHGAKVAVIGAGGIGFDVAEYLVHSADNDFYAQFGVDRTLATRGGLVKPTPPKSERTVTVFQRSKGKFGADLGKTTGWIHRLELKQHNVKMVGSVGSYDRFDDDGLHVTLASGDTMIEPADYVIVCAGQVEHSIADDIAARVGDAATAVHVVGGAGNAKGLDAARAIREAVQVADRI
eukprot:TRINITY_DN988_c0_g1_i1.p1 TRINITY_DN988_c0_g1~~TRINITY_DN988_c0_g1_i1.p1  ORF type:complete len:229 (+),score=134.03 TRINITY_DN988_c0_g1_i1:24-710(+)